MGGRATADRGGDGGDDLAVPDAPRLTQYAWIEGLDTLRRLLDPPDKLIAAPMKIALTELGQMGAESGKAAAPTYRGPPRRKYQPGQTKKRIFAAVDKKAFPRWAAVRSRGARQSMAYPRGYPYPRLLNYAGKYGHAGWFDRGVIAPVMAKADTALNKAANLIATKWGRY